MAHRIKSPVFTSFLAASLLTACVSKNDDPFLDTGHIRYVATHSYDGAYTGNENPAHLTINNASAFTLSLFDNEDFSDALNNDTSPKGRPNTLVQQRPVYNACQFGGTVVINETASTTTFDFTACRRNYPSQFDGAMKLTVNAYDSQNNPTIYTLDTNNLFRTEGASKKSFIGNIRFSESASTVTSTANLFRSDTRTSIQYLLHDFKLVDSQTDVVSGRVYRSTDGYIVLSSSVDLITNTYGAPSQGYIYLNGAKGSTIRLSKPSDSTLRHYVSMGIDADGDGTYEEQTLLDITRGTDESK